MLGSELSGVRARLTSQASCLWNNRTVRIGLRQVLRGIGEASAWSRTRGTRSIPLRDPKYHPVHAVHFRGDVIADCLRAPCRPRFGRA